MDTPGAVRKKRKASKWYGQYTDADGLDQRVPLSASKTVAQQKLAALVNKNENAKIGMVDLSAAVDSLPSPSSPGPKTERQTLRATGTDGRALRVALTADGGQDGLRLVDTQESELRSAETLAIPGFVSLSETKRDGLTKRPFPGLNRGMTDLQSVAFPLG